MSQTINLNQKNTFLISIIIFMLLTVSSCEYKPTDVYDRKIIHDPSSPSIEAVELNLNEDTIFFYLTEMIINFSFRSSNQEINLVKFSVDGTEKMAVESSSGQFKFDNIYFPFGIHSLKIDVFTHSGSSSIADLLGMERYMFSKTWILKCENIRDKKTKIEVENGYLKLTFPKYKNPDLNEYIIYRDLNAYTNEIARVKSNIFIDSGYVGEGGSYKVHISTTSGSNIGWNQVSLVKELPVLSSFVTKDNLYHLLWTKNKYYNALQSYYIIQRDIIHNKETTLSLTNPEDTVINLAEVMFNDGLYIRLRSIPKKGNVFYNSSFYYQFESEINFNAGIPFNIAYSEGKVFPVNEDEFVYAQSGIIYRCSVSQNKILESMEYPGDCSNHSFKNLEVSPRGKNIIAYVSCNKEFFRSSAFNFQDYSITNVNALTSSSFQISVSDVGTGIVPNSLSKIYLYDFVNSKILGSFQSYIYVYSNMEISSDGNYFFIPSDTLRYFKFDNGQFKLIWKTYLGANSAFYAFDPLNDDKLALWVNSVFYVKQCSDFTTINEFPLSATRIFNIDFHKNQVLAYAPRHLYVIRISDGKLLYDIPINFALSPYLDECFLLNNTIISRKSVSYILN
jgi:hypothetical protein